MAVGVATIVFTPDAESVVEVFTFIDPSEIVANEIVIQTVVQHGSPKLFGKFRSIQKSRPESSLIREENLNDIGNELLAREHSKEAIETFMLNVEFYPESANTYEGLADAYMANGEHDLAIANYQKALKLDPDNENVKQKLKNLTNQWSAANITKEKLSEPELIPTQAI